MALKRAEYSVLQACNLSSESVQSTSLPLEGIDDIHSGDSLPLGVFGVGDGIPDHVLEEDLEDSASLLIDEPRDPLDSSPPRQTTDSGLSDTLDVVSQHLTVTLGTPLSEPLASFTTTGHFAVSSVTVTYPGDGTGIYTDPPPILRDCRPPASYLPSRQICELIVLGYVVRIKLSQIFDRIFLSFTQGKYGRKYLFRLLLSENFL